MHTKLWDISCIFLGFEISKRLPLRINANLSHQSTFLPPVGRHFCLYYWAISTFIFPSSIPFSRLAEYVHMVVELFLYLRSPPVFLCSLLHFYLLTHFYILKKCSFHSVCCNTRVYILSQFCFYLRNLT
jgi:hypothetical protein